MEIVPQREKLRGTAGQVDGDVDEAQSLSGRHRRGEEVALVHRDDLALEAAEAARAFMNVTDPRHHRTDAFSA